MNRKLWLLMTWLLVVPAFVQAASVRGVVVDYETNKPIANVKVRYGTCRLLRILTEILS